MLRLYTFLELMPQVGGRTNIEQLIWIACEVLGSMTLKREDIQAGIEPDASFYIAHESRIRGVSRLDLPKDPPPDLCVEVGITHPTLDKLALYAAFGVPEVWSYDGRTLEIHLLHGDQYRTSGESRALPHASAEEITQLLSQRTEAGSIAWARLVRERAGKFSDAG